MIRLEKVRWQNFLATGNDFIEIDIPRAPSTLILGANGNGKTTLIEAISFALFNKPFRKVNRDKLINRATGKNLLVECEFTVGPNTFMVRRGIKPAVFEIYKNGTLVPPPSDVREYQEILERDILRRNHKTFSQVEILGSGGYTPFMQLTTPARREFVEDFLDLKVFSTMNSLLKDRVDANKAAVTDKTNQIKILDAKIEMSEKHAADSEKEARESIARWENDKAKLKVERDALRDKGTELLFEATRLQATIRDEAAAQEGVNKAKTASIKFKQYKETIQKELNFLNHSEMCPTCRQGISPDFKISRAKELKDKLAEEEAAYFKIVDEASPLAIRLMEIENVKKNVSALIRDAENMGTQADGLSRQIDTLNSYIDSVERTLFQKKQADDVGKLREQRDVLLEEWAGLDKERATLTAASGLLKDGGIKARIIAQYIPTLNGLINKYLAELDFVVDFRLNENFEETILARGRDELPYESFSEGEKMRFDLAILFAWRELARLRNSTSMNILIADETLDRSMDNGGVEEFLKILNRQNDSTVFVISHRGDQLSDKFDRVIRFEKVHGFSKLVEGE